jgi:hypothetical protein
MYTHTNSTLSHLRIKPLNGWFISSYFYFKDIEIEFDVGMVPGIDSWMEEKRSLSLGLVDGEQLSDLKAPFIR